MLVPVHRSTFVSLNNLYQPVGCRSHPVLRAELQDAPVRFNFLFDIRMLSDVLLNNQVSVYIAPGVCVKLCSNPPLDEGIIRDSSSVRLTWSLSKMALNYIPVPQQPTGL